MLQWFAMPSNACRFCEFSMVFLNVVRSHSEWLGVPWLRSYHWLHRAQPLSEQGSMLWQAVQDWTAYTACCKAAYIERMATAFRIPQLSPSIWNIWNWLSCLVFFIFMSDFLPLALAILLLYFWWFRVERPPGAEMGLWAKWPTSACQRKAWKTGWHAMARPFRHIWSFPFSLPGMAWQIEKMSVWPFLPGPRHGSGGRKHFCHFCSLGTTSSGIGTYVLQFLSQAYAKNPKS